MNEPRTFGVVATTLAERGWRPLPLSPGTKLPIELEWDRANRRQYTPGELRNLAADHYEAAVGLAMPSTQLAIDIDITTADEAAIVADAADRTMGVTPLVRIGQAPKHVRLYRADGSIRATKPHPIEIYANAGQVAVFGWHTKAGKPYTWPNLSPLDVNADSPDLPMVTQQELDKFITAIAPVLAKLRKARRASGGAGIGIDASDYLRQLLDRGLPFRAAAGRVLSGAADGGRHYAIRAVISAGFNRGIDEDQLRRVINAAAPADLLELVAADGYLERTIQDFLPSVNEWNSTTTR
jgi:hypothetical protein